MEFEKMCDKDSQGLYTLLFPNKHVLQMNEIEEFFSQFEGFNDVRAAGTEKGFRFPRFKSEEGARRAFEAVIDHPTISLIPYVNRRKNNNNQENRSNKENSRNNNRSNSKKDTSQSIWDADKPQILEEKSQEEDSPKMFSGSAVENKVSSVSMRLMKYKRDPALISEEIKSSNENLTQEESMKCNELNGVSDNNAINIAINENNNEIYDSGAENNIEYKVNGVDYDTTANQSNGVYEDTITNKVNGFSEESNSQYSEIYEENDSEIPGLMMRAGEVVVGNIHPSFGPAFILHLFDRYKPIAVTTIQNINNWRSRYCHVYFKTQADAAKVEEQFDGYDLMGWPLIVLQPKTLVELTPC